MRIKMRFLSGLCPLLAVAMAALASPVSAQGLVGLWEFENASGLTDATIGSTLVATGTDTAVAGSGGADIGAASLDNGDFYRAVNPIGGTGGGVETNAYSILMDISTVAGGFNALLETDNVGGSDGDIFINGAGGIGISSDYDGTAADGTFKRILMVYDQAAIDNWSFYIDGVLANVAITGEAVDGRWGLGATFDVFSDNGGGEENTTSVSNLALFDTALTATDAAGFGGAGSPIVAVPEPTSMAVLGGALVILGVRRRRFV